MFFLLSLYSLIILNYSLILLHDYNFHYVSVPMTLLYIFYLLNNSKIYKPISMTNKLYMTHPRNFGKDSRPCRVCTNRRGVISKYDLQICRKCFRE